MNAKTGINWDEFSKNLIAIYQGPTWRKAGSEWLGPQRDGYRNDRKLELKYHDSISSLVREYKKKAVNDIERILFELRIEKLFFVRGNLKYSRFFVTPEDFSELPKSLKEAKAAANEDRAREELLIREKRKEEEEKRNQEHIKMRQEKEAGEKYSENEKLWFRLNNEFKKSLEYCKGLGYQSEAQYKIEIGELGNRLDEEYKKEAGIPISELIGFSTFTYKAKRIQKNLNKQKSKEEKFKASLKAGSMPAERAISFLLLNKANVADELVISKGKLDYQVCWILDAVSHRFIGYLLSDEEWKDAKDPQPLIIGKENLINTAEEFMAMRESNEEEFQKNVIMISLSDSEIKRAIGKPNLSNKRISGLVERLREIELTGKHFQFWDAEEGWTNIDKEISLPFVSVEVEKIHRKLRGKGADIGSEQNYKFWFWSYWGLAFLSNLHGRKLDLFPKRFYELSGKAQELFRAIGWSKQSTWRNIENISSLLGWKDVSEIKQIQTRRAAIRRILDELKKNEFIKDWSSSGHGVRTGYKVTKRKKLPKNI